MDRFYILIFFIIFLSVSCRTVQKESAVPAEPEFEEFQGDADLEEEFADSEDLEQEFAGLEEDDDLVESKEDVESEETAQAEEEDSPDDEEEEFLLVDEEDIEDLEESVESEETAQAEEEKEGDDIEKEILESEAGPDEEELAESEAGPDEEEELAESEAEPGEEELAESEEELDEEENLAESEEGPEEETLQSSVLIENIRYLDAEKKIYIDSTGSFSYTSRENATARQTIIEIPGARLSKSLKWPFVMKDFDTEIGLLMADQKNENTVRIVVQMKKNALSPLVEMSEEGALVIASQGRADGDFAESSAGAESGEGALLPAKSLGEFLTAQHRYTGRPISIHLKDVEVKDVLHLISEGTGLNMVISDDVRGNITLKLKNIPWDQALLLVMKTKKLGYLREGNVIRIMTLASLEQDQQKLMTVMQNQQTLAPLRVKIIPVAYEELQNINTIAQALLSPPREKIVLNQRSNSLILTATEDNIKKIEDLIKVVDEPPKQVMIEAKIVEARENFVRSLGLNWNFQGERGSFPVLGGRPDLTLDLGGSLTAFPGARTGEGQSEGGSTLTFPFNISFAPVGFLDAVISLSETDDTTNVISSPRILVLNGEQATISQQTEIVDRVSTISDDGGRQEAPQRTPVVLNFGVTPKITSIGSVFLDIDMKRDFAGTRAPGDTSRPVNSREAKTKVLVNNGQTVVIGGIYQNDQTSFKEGFPILKHIPILKWLFSQKTKDESRNELLLFVTPRVLNMDKNSEETQELNL